MKSALIIGAAWFLFLLDVAVWYDVPSDFRNRDNLHRIIYDLPGGGFVAQLQYRLSK